MTVTRPKCDTIFGWVTEIEHTTKPTPSILKLFFGFDTMLRKKKYIDSH